MNNVCSDSDTTSLFASRNKGEWLKEPARSHDGSLTSHLHIETCGEHNTPPSVSLSTDPYMCAEAAADSAAFSIDQCSNNRTHMTTFDLEVIVCPVLLTSLVHGEFESMCWASSYFIDSDVCSMHVWCMLPFIFTVTLYRCVCQHLCM